MNVKLRVLSAGVLFFMGGQIFAQTKNDTIPKKESIDAPKETKIEEVVILGYNNKRLLKDNNGAVTTVTPELIENRPNINALASIQGQAAGLQISFNSGSPGSNKITALIRGAGSISGSNSPLYVVDGVPVSETYFRSINPDDIASSSILKDAAATSIYGNRGSNGVIIITTKGGRYNSALKVGYSANVGVSELQKHRYNIAGSSETLKLEREFDTGTGAGLTDEEIAAFPNTRWDKIFFRKGFTQNHSLTLQGGGENLSNFTSFNYLDQDGIVANTGFKRMSVRTNLQGKSKNDRFNFSTNIALTFSRRNQLEQETRTDINANVLQNPLQGLLSSLPYLDPNVYVSGQQLFDEFGAPSFQIVPYMLMDYLNPRNIPSRFDELRLVASAMAKYKFTENLSAQFTSGADYSNENRLFARAPWSYLAIISRPANVEFGGIEQRSDTKDLALTNVLKVTYEKTFAEKHHVEVSAFTEYLKYHRITSSFTQNGLDPKTWVVGAGTGWPAFTPNPSPGLYRPTIAAAKNDAGLFSYFGTLNYDYGSKYGISGSIRRDAAYKFAENNKWGTFWSVGARWNIEQEEFMKSSSFGLLKLRASYGTQGNQNILAAAAGFNPIYLGASLVRALTSTAGSGYGLNPQLSTTIANEDLRWEVQKQANIGLDFDYKNGLISGTVDVYDKRTNDLYSISPLSAVTGQYQINGNIGDMYNRGVELSLRSNVINKQDLKLAVFANGAYNKNRVTKLAPGNTIPTNPFLTTNNTNTLYGRTAEGHMLGEYFLVPYLGANPTDGTAQFLDRNGNITSTPTNDDRRWTGKSFLPVYQGGFGLNANYKGLFLDVLFTYAAKVWRSDFDLDGLSNPSNLGIFPITSDLLNAWTPTNTNTDVPSLTDITGADFASDFSDRFLKDASYIRLRNITLGYNFGKDMLKGTPISQLRIYIQAENFVTWTKWRGFDVEGGVSSNQGGFPTPRATTIGVDVQF
ncbi:TonB-linked SusC/RagA family outer membrane protein [Chryseobacterium sp. SLBN-27]|uniref:SusC/RagA family TonB-linked outer membrane protein n=1 Tax=Chryseobacterium sp. SLBN-27 TaxID=3042287 RepID=UPI002862C1F2|nr:SusC/RagA family TonB-linked outer membrane protein [Chryseobacterium sp. SLBN-27]MDR6159074.1 TonB-linked SusC/RagA family outer membrane protein [Chryseobacterium sp. SLBN-27]